MIRAVVPGEIELRLNEPGTYTIFHEHHYDLRRPRLQRGEAFPPLEITLRSRTSGAVVPLKGYNHFDPTASAAAPAGRCTSSR